MAEPVLYGIRNCDSVKKARAWLDKTGVEYRFHDYKAAGVDADRLERWCDEVGWERLLNRAGTTFRKLAPSEKENLDRKSGVALMRSQPSVIKRPVLELGRRVVVGFDDELYKSLPW